MAEHGNGNGNNRVQVNWQSLLTFLAAWLVSAILAYGAVDARVKVLESSYERLLQDMREMKTDVREVRDSLRRQ
jgi:hypothetical protein